MSTTKGRVKIEKVIFFTISNTDDECKLDFT